MGSPSHIIVNGASLIPFLLLTIPCLSFNINTRKKIVHFDHSTYKNSILTPLSILYIGQLLKNTYFLEMQKQRLTVLQIIV